jgi:acyl carrier protein
MAAVIAEAREVWGEVHGVIHAAGVAGGGILPLKTVGMARDVLAPKVEGTLILHELLRGMPLDFLILCSSVNAWLGGVGQVDYCAANRFLDAFAHWDRAQNQRSTLSINWDTWQEVGMAVHTRVPDALRAERQASLKAAITPAEGKEVLARLLGWEFSQVIVSPRNFPAMVERSRRRTLSPSPDHPVPATASPAGVPSHQRPDLSGEYVAPRNETEHGIATIWQHLLGLDRVGVHDHFLEVGGHSLLAVQMNSRLRDTFQVQLPLQVVLDNPTVAKLSELVAAHHASPVDDQTLQRLVEEISQLPEEEVQSRLDAEKEGQAHE